MLEAGAPPEKVLGQLGWLVRAKFPTIARGDLAAAVEALFRTDLDLKRFRRRAARPAGAARGRIVRGEKGGPRARLLSSWRRIRRVNRDL